MGGGGVIEQQPTPGALIQAAAEIPASKERGSTVPAVLGQQKKKKIQLQIIAPHPFPRSLPPLTLRTTFWGPNTVYIESLVLVVLAEFASRGQNLMSVCVKSLGLVCFFVTSVVFFPASNRLHLLL